jgi:DNA-binding response OmpR family regulator
VKVLIADDDPISLRLLESALVRSGYEVALAENGTEAFEILNKPGGPKLAVLDWMMPGLDGVEICRRLRTKPDLQYIYIVLLTVKRDRTDLATGFDAGVDDYLIKPFDSVELSARIAAGERLLNLQTALNAKVQELEDALSHVKQLQGLIPICMHCKKIRDDASTWHRLETYIQEHSGAVFTHSLCESCLQEHYPTLEKTAAAVRHERSKD